ncbi:MAG: hypothetical protein AAF514_17090 [Verrucomicrobiota bacterium]
MTQTQDPAAGISGQAPSAPVKKKSKFWKIFGIGIGVILLALLLAALMVFFWYRYNFHAGKFNPINLSKPEVVVVEEKLEKIGETPPRSQRDIGEAVGERHAVSEMEVPIEESVDPAEEARTVMITEKELNGMLHKNTGLGDELKIVLDRDSIGARWVKDMPDDVPILGGKTIRVKVGVGAYIDENGKLALMINNVTLGGVPMPNAWLGDIKGINVVEEYGSDIPLLDNFARGIKELKIEDGRMMVILNE